MSMTTAELQKLALSQVISEDLPQGDNPNRTSGIWTIEDIIKADFIKGASYNDTTQAYSFVPQLAALSGMLGWTLINFQPNTVSGFAGAAFKNTANELVFAFRGTEPHLSTNPVAALQDFAQDLQIAMDTNLPGPSQFEDAFNFFTNTYDGNTYNGYSFTGHSLGGGLAQYMVYQTNEGGHATTFNAVGIGQGLTGVNPSDYNDSIKDYVNQNDIIGQYGVQLGQTIYVTDSGGHEYNSSIDNTQTALQMAILQALKNGDISQAQAMAALLGISQAGQGVYNAGNDLLFGAHGLDSLVTSTGASNQEASGPNLAMEALTAVINNRFSVVGWAVNGVSYIALEVIPEVGEAVVKVTLAIADGVVQVATAIGEATWNWVNFMGDTTADIIYNTAVTIGTLADTAAEVAVMLYQVLFSEYVTVNGSGGDDELSALFYNKSTIFNAFGGDDIVSGTGNKDVIKGGSGNDTLYGYGGTDYIYGGSGNDILLGGSGSDVLIGGDGDDTLYGGDERNWESYFTPEHAPDVLDGGAGNDMLQGGTGNDTYIFGIGYGHDIISDWGQDVVEGLNGGYDTLKFLAGVSPSDVSVRRINETDLEFKITSTGETVTVAGFFNGGRYYSYPSRIEEVVFADGTVWDTSILMDKARYLRGTATGDTISGYYDQSNIIYGYAGNDIIMGSNYSDQLIGGEGNDHLSGGQDIDILDGGTGNDTLEGGAGDDVYKFGYGYGHDTIYDHAPSTYLGYSDGGSDTVFFLEGVEPQDVEVRRVGVYGLEFRLQGSDDTLLVNNHFYYYGINNINQALFANGTVWSLEDINNRAIDTVGTAEHETLYGNDMNNIIAAGAGDDALYGYAGNDTLDGGIGADHLNGGIGDDVYIFGPGYGIDTVFDSDAAPGNVDTIRFLQGINPSDIVITRNGSNVELAISGTDDKLIIERYFSAYNQSNNYVGESAHKIERFEFSDGTIWTTNNIEDVIRVINGTELDDTIYGYNDLGNIITSGDGNDVISGGSLNDQIDAGNGDDTIYAGHGNDILVGGAGNDTLYGEYGNDTISGGTGDDVLEGGEGNDIYLFGIGHGSDTIYDSDITEGNQDKIRFLEGITPDAVRATRSGDNLILNIIGTSDTLTIERYFSEYARTSGWYSYNVGSNGNKIEVIEFSDGTTWSVADVKDKVRHITGTSGDDYLSGFADQQNIISAGNGNDIVYAAQMGDELRGEAGNDTLYGGAGNDVLVGGTGDDILEGSSGNDTYEFNLGFGTDTIYDSDTTAGNIDTISFLGSIAPEDVIVTRNGENLELTIVGNTDKLIVEKYFSEYARTSGWYSYNVGPNGNKIERITFTDGTVWDIDTITDIVRRINGTVSDDTLQGLGDQHNIISGGDGDDVIYAGGLGDELYGGADNDTLYGSSGNDTLAGESGNDILEGSYGNDTYLFNIGDGDDVIYDSDVSGASQDKIIFGSGITKEGVTLQRDGDNLVFTFAGSTDTLTIERYFSQYGRVSGWSQPYVGISGNKIEQIQFADGVVWNNETVIEKVAHVLGTSGADALTGIEGQQSKLSGLDGDDLLTAASYGDYLDGGSGNDTLNGSYGQDTLRGGTGNDTLIGGVGSDTYEFSLGDGHDTIYDGDSSYAVDTISFTEGIEASSVTAVRDGNDIVLKINGGATDSITIQDYFSGVLQGSGYHYGIGVNKVERIKFADGTIWDTASLEDQFRYITGTSGNDILSGYETDDIITAQDGDDTIHAGLGNDTVTAGSGDDTIYGEIGNDQLSGDDGNDVIDGGVGNDILDGGVGNDTLIGGEGSDTYIFKIGDGSDEIHDFSTTASEIDTIAFEAGITPQDVTLQRNGDDLALLIANTTDSLTIRGYFSAYQEGDPTEYTVGVNKIERVVFVDGTVWNSRTLEYAISNTNGIVNPAITFGNTNSENLYADQDGQMIYADEGDDTIIGQEGDDTLHGEAGNDTIYAGLGHDTLVGGEGNDFLDGGEGNDTYVFSPGFGHDTIVDYDTTQGNIDTIAFSSGITPDDITLSRVGNNLVLSLATGDSITVQGYYASAVSGSRKIEQVTFANGTIWDTSFLETAVPPTSTYDNSIEGSEYNDYLYGTTGNDAISGGAGNDVIYSDNGIYDGVGNDLLDGGTGDDTLYGAGGDDTYVFGLGYGQDYLRDELRSGSGAYIDGGFDTIKILPGVAPEDIIVRRSGEDMILAIAGTTDSMVVSGFFRNVEGVYTSAIERVEFSDASQTVWTINDLIAKAKHITGTSASETLYGHEGQDNVLSAGAGDDTVYGASGNDTLDGGVGNDQLQGGYGNDTYIFGVGYGVDTIYDSDSTDNNQDTIQFLEGVTPQDVRVTRNGDNLELSINGTADKLIVERYFSQYTRNGYYAGSEDANKIERVTFADGTIWNVSDVKEKARYISGSENDEYLYGYSDQQNIMSAGNGNDTMYAGSLGDQMDGGAGNDSLFGSSGNDILTGGAGDDRLEGAGGDDTYVFAAGFGNDVIYDADPAEENSDTIRFLEGIAPESVTAKRSGDNLVLTIAGTSDTLTVERYFSQYTRNGYYAGSANAQKVEVIEFSDGTTWTIADIKEKVRYVHGTENGDTIYGFGDQQNIIAAGNGDDTVYASSLGDEVDGGAGNDSLFGSSGADTLTGGIGNDILEGSSGNDTYVFGAGYGIDTIYDNDTTQGNLDVVNFLPGIAPEDIYVQRNGDNLELRITGTEDILIVERYFSPYARNSWYTYDVNMNRIEEFHFDDGTVWDATAIHDKARFIEGTSGNDSIYGYSDQQNIINAGDGNDTVYASTLGGELYGEAGNDSLYGSSGIDILNGGSGNDNLEGSSGNDTYIFGLGDGVDTIYDNDTTAGNTDVISFQAGIAPEEIEVVRNGDNLELRISGTADMVTVERYFSPYARGSWYTYDYNMNKIEQIVFADGTTWDVATVLNKARTVNGTENADTIYGYSDQQNIITTGTGNDTVYAGSMGDQIDTGEGNDNVYGSEGADRITGGAGNDTLEGGNGNDTYVFAPGFGIDTIYDNDSGQGNSLDVVEFSAGIAAEDVVVRRLTNDDLEITILGTTDKLTIQRFFSNYYRNSSWNTGANSNAIEEFRFADGTTWSVNDIKDKARFMTGSANDDTIYGFGDQQNIIAAGDGNDTVYAGSSLNDELYGEAGNDTLVGSWSSEKFDGGSGNDYMEGSAGDDAYVFGVGYGQDVIYDSDQGQGTGLDKITFLEGIDPADVSVKRLPNGDLEITFAGTTDKLTVERYFSSYYKNSSWNTGVNSNVVEELHFADGTIWTTATIKDKVRTAHGTENSDTLQGYGDQQNLLYAGAGDDTVYAGGLNGDELYGEDGNDTLVGSWASETLDGGIGNDYLEGSAGDDTYVFGPGYGHDTIYDSNQGQSGGIDKVMFLSGINPADVTAKRLPNSDLELTFTNSNDKLTIERYFSPYYKNSSWNVGTNSNVVEEFHFADNTVWDIDNIKTMVRTINGTENNDVLYGYEDADTITAGTGDDTVYAGYANDVIYGGAGNDILYGEDGDDQLNGGIGNDTLDGGYGDDIYIFSGAFGSDQINDYHGNDLVQFSDLNKDTIMFEQVGNALQITSAGASDSVSIGYWYSYSDYKIESIKASDGSTISSAQVEQLIQAMASWSNDNNGMSWSQALASNSQDVQSIVAQYWTAPTA